MGSYGWWCGFFGGQIDAYAFVWLSHAAAPGDLCAVVLKRCGDGSTLSETKCYNEFREVRTILAGGVNPKAAVLKARSLERFDFTPMKGNFAWK